jgi:L-fuculose-phosphate aldolase
MKNGATAEAIIRVGQRMHQQRLTVGTSGNISARTKDGCLITASGAACADLGQNDLVPMSLDGTHDTGHRPSSEWRFHVEIYRTRPEVNGIVHAHPPFCTALACDNRSIPAFHYMVAVAGGTDIRCAPYATFGTAELSGNALKALEDRRACLLANHGMIAVGETVETALGLAVDVETLAEQYWRALQIGEPAILTTQQMAEVLERFDSYRRHD